MSFFFCESKQYEPETFKGFGGGREVVSASSVEDARKNIEKIKKEKTSPYYRLLLANYGFCGHYKKKEMAQNIRRRYVRKNKRHKWV